MLEFIKNITNEYSKFSISKILNVCKIMLKKNWVQSQCYYDTAASLSFS